MDLLTVASLERGGRTAPRDIIQGVTPEWDFIFCGRTDKEDWTKSLEGADGGSGEVRQLKRLLPFKRTMTEKSRQFYINLSDATAILIDWLIAIRLQMLSTGTWIIMRLSDKNSWLDLALFNSIICTEAVPVTVQAQRSPVKCYNLSANWRRSKNGTEHHTQTYTQGHIHTTKLQKSDKTKAVSPHHLKRRVNQTRSN